MEKGEIYIAIDKQSHPHPIVFLEWINKVTFKACIISHETRYGNIQMLQEHFLINDDNENPYKIQFENSHLITNETFRKMEFWVSCNEVAGKLTNEGISFIEKYIDANKEPILCPASIKEFNRG